MNTLERVDLDSKSWIEFDADFCSQSESDEILQHLLNEIDWKESWMILKDGTRVMLPRLQCWMSDPGVKAQVIVSKSCK